MSKRTSKRFISAFFAVAALVLLVFNGVLAWVITGPRSLDAITPYIESALAPEGNAYRVSIGNTQLIWDGWEHPIGIHVKNVAVLNDKGAVIAVFPEVGIRLYFYKLLVGKVDLKSLEVLSPVVLLVQGDNGELSFGFSQQENTADTSLSSILSLLVADEGDNPVTHLTSLIIRDARVSVKKLHSGIFLQSPKASLEVTRKHGNVKGTLVMPLQFDDKNGEINAEFSLSKKDKNVIAEVIYTDIPSTALHALFPAQQWMDAAKIPLTGWAHLISDFDGNVDALDFMAEAGAGTITYPSQFEEPLELNRIHVAGSLTDKLSTLTVKEGLLDFKKFNITFNGTVHKQGEEYSLDGFAETANVPVDEVHRYWPLTLSPHSRGWVTSRITHGVMTKGSVSAHFKPGELKLKDTPRAAIDATIDVKDATVKYMPKHPVVSEVNGEIKFTGDTMDAKITHANYMTDTHVTFAALRFPDLNPADVRLFMDMDLETSAKDVKDFLTLPELNKAAKLHLTDAISGKAKGNVKLDFIAFSENEKENSAAEGHINYAVAADLIGVSQQGFLGNRDVSDANMKINLNNKGIKAAGTATINQLPMTIDLTNNFARGSETNYAVKLDMPVASLPDFGLPKLDFAKGVMGVNATFIESDTVDKADAKIDLTRTSIDLPEHGFSKKMGDKAVLALATEGMGEGNTVIKSFALSGPETNASGKAEFDKAINDFRSFSFDALRMGKTDLDSLQYEKVPGGIKLTARGRAFDVSPYMQRGKGKSPEQDYSIDVKVDRLILGEKHEFSNATIAGDCKEQCRSATIAAKLADNTPFNYSISDGKLNSTCNNAGELLRTLGLFDTIDGGKMVLTGNYAGNKLEGNLEMTDYTLKNAPVLTKAFTIASLSGILDTLTGKGIYFSRLSAPFTFAHDMLILKDAKTHGSALGVTAEGTIDIRNNIFDLQGTLVPSYTLNSLVGNVPLIGDLLMGGTGKGLIALNYTVKGDMNDPSITVNPLSALTPGFLRGVFNVFDEPTPDLDKIAADRKKAEEKEAAPPANAVAPISSAPVSNAPAPVSPTP